MAETVDTSGLGADLYTPEQRRRRDRTPWTLVQGVLAPLQFLAFLTNLGEYYSIFGQLRARSGSGSLRKDEKLFFEQNSEPQLSFWHREM